MKALDFKVIAEVPELPGCAADGESHRGALANVEVVMQEWIETAKEAGRAVADPTSGNCRFEYW